ncbi:RNA-binding protein [Candidatus Beckwithbacteria bacterium CG23_combo_of_CG06-09_8_20_14_all_34_8]|uniref:RNA-binding protein KhpA n=1 Tax=Candidatus Beckwithbacteria bacterium CG23_combo_of_CG06-09_8_20_14_all_34_8 TaxID=1974497 RepID=A0A2H0B7E3_9BACT|nr:MAG: RNA-binding protein [Candidatus Beckwithbacteria bacterium CG23_combo_of_CG06-09_8_20_14_all_34_8]
MEKLLHFLLENIVDHPEDIVINQYENDYGVTVLEASVHPEDMGKVIGKEGKIISAIRKILKVKAIKSGIHFQFTLLESAPLS